MSIFLYGSALSKKVDELLSENCTCIVSYIGKGVKDKIKKINKKKKINFICNFRSNGTNPYEVEKLIRYLGPKKVKQMDSFHAKVYYSESGAVICSANLSTNGLELFNEPANQLEAGIFVKNDELAYKEVLKWHKSLSEKIYKIERQEIKDRQSIYKKTSDRVRINLTIDEFLDNRNSFGLFFCLDDSPVEGKRDTTNDNGIKKTIEKYMEDHGFYDWTEESQYKRSTDNLGKTKDLIKNRILLNISGVANDDELPIPSTLKISSTLLKFGKDRPVKMKDNNKNTLLFFYKKDNEYKITNSFKKELTALLKDSLRDKSKRKNWKKWINSPEGQGYFMSIDTLKKLI